MTVPLGWEVTKLGEVAGFEMGQAPPAENCNFNGEGVVFVKAGEFGQIYPVVREWTTKPLKFAYKGDILVCVVGATAGKINLGLDCAIGRSVAAVRPYFQEMQNIIYFQLKMNVKKLREGSTGSAQGVISKQMLFDEPIHLPPLNEQRRVADKLETVLTRVDAVQDRLARITPLLKRFRQSILAAATSGRLTADWRQGDGAFSIPWITLIEFRERALPVLPSTWRWVEFSQIAKVKSDLRNPIEYQEEPHLAPNHIESWSGRISGCRTIGEDAVISPKHWFSAGEIVYSKIRPNLCKVAIPDFSGLCSADMYPISTKINDRYLFFWMLGERFTSWAANAESRTVLPKINTKELGKIPVPVTSDEEQTEIVRRVELLMAYADRLEARLKAAQTAAERLTPALLAKAFRGELVPQAPTDEPASELLRRLREQRAAQAPVKPKRGPRKVAAQ